MEVVEVVRDVQLVQIVLVIRGIPGDDIHGLCGSIYHRCSGYAYNSRRCLSADCRGAGQLKSLAKYRSRIAASVVYVEGINHVRFGRDEKKVPAATWCAYAVHI